MKTHMSVFAKNLMFELDPKKNRPFPSNKDIKEAILEDFGIARIDTVTQKMLKRVWVETLEKKVKKLIINRRGRFSTTIRTHLWQFLEVPKLLKGTKEEIST